MLPPVANPVAPVLATRRPDGFADRLRQKQAAAGRPPAEAQAADVVVLSAPERELVARLAQTDRRVRAHEQAHLAAAGPYATSGAQFQTVRGPDGQQYAVAGEVQIDVSAVPGDPEATLRKAQTVQAAANAPADPSPQDRAVAAAAARLEADARRQIADQIRLLARAYQTQPPASGQILSALA